jgi:hypothetical protein
MEGRPLWQRMVLPTLVFGTFGFALGLLFQLRVDAGNWGAALTLSGLGAGTGAGIGVERRENAFPAGIVGAIDGALAGVFLAATGTALGGAISLAFVVAAGIGGRVTSRADPEDMQDEAD